MTRYFATPLFPLLVLSGCAVGPDYVPPAAPTVQRYTAEALPPATVATPVAGGTAQHFVPGEPTPERWWTSFGSDALNNLVEVALAANPDLQAAQAALQAAQENRAAQHGAYLPTLDVQLAPGRQRVASTLSSPTASGANLYTLHTAQLNIGYVPDVFGGVRRQVEAADAQAEVARCQAQAVRLTLIANLVVAAISEAALQAQLETTQELVLLAHQQLDAVRRQQQAGQVGPADVAAEAGLLAQVEGSVPALEKQLAQQRNLLAVLAGRLPADEAPPRLQFDSLALSATLPLGVPAQLVQQRPDIRAAEAQLHAASAQIGVATAARLPDITLSAALGGSALDAGTLFRSGTGFWSIGANLLQPVFRGGALLHAQHASEAAYAQSAAQYRSVVLTAFQNVADTLHAIEADARSLHSAAAAAQAARQSLDIARRQWQLGAIGYPAVLLAQQSWQQATLTLIAARAARYTDTVALYQALGGGWDAAGR